MNVPILSNADITVRQRPEVPPYSVKQPAGDSKWNLTSRALGDSSLQPSYGLAHVLKRAGQIRVGLFPDLLYLLFSSVFLSLSHL
jgi:hypothetical protein